MNNVKGINHPWSNMLSYCNKKAYKELMDVIEEEYKERQIFPPYGFLFKAFELVPFSLVRVVILGQDPYHNDGQAEGLAFSIPQGINLPPSLKNIFKELANDLGVKRDINDGSLVSWAEQGVLLLNSILTVVAHMPSSHSKIGWEEFTDSVIQKISDEHAHIVFILWGKYAESKEGLINSKKHLVLKAAHPSPFSAYKGFFGCNHFSKCNDYLKKKGIQEIVW